jgi:hypothetical protein
MRAAAAWTSAIVIESVSMTFEFPALNSGAFWKKVFFFKKKHSVCRTDDDVDGWMDGRWMVDDGCKRLIQISVENNPIPCGCFFGVVCLWRAPHFVCWVASTNHISARQPLGPETTRYCSIASKYNEY